MDGENAESAAPATTSRKSNGNKNVNQLLAPRRIQDKVYSFDGWKMTVLKSSILPSNCYCDALDTDNTKGLLLELGCGFESVRLPNSDETTNHSNESLPLVKCHVCRLVTRYSIMCLLFRDFRKHVLRRFIYDVL